MNNGTARGEEGPTEIERLKGVARWKREIHRLGPRSSGSEASFKIGIIMFFHLSELEMMTRRLSILWEQKSVRNTSAGFFVFLFFFFFFRFFLFFHFVFFIIFGEETRRNQKLTVVNLNRHDYIIY